MLGRVERDLARDDEIARLGAEPRRQAQVADAAGGDKADVAVPQAVLAAGLADGVAPLGARERKLEQDGLCLLYTSRCV